ncbi:MAG TPA: DUF5063 domain-containing protein [Bacteroidales bacterium]
MKKNEDVIYDKNTIEFVAVAVSFCALLESQEPVSKEVLVDRCQKILPLLYLKAMMLPKVELLSEDELESLVAEEEYESLRQRIAGTLGEQDDYLEVFHPDMPYSDTPVLATLSEDLADIYQDIKNFVCIFRLGNPETMNDALYLCKENFKEFWGQRLTNAMRAFHAIMKTYEW